MKTAQRQYVGGDDTIGRATEPGAGARRQVARIAAKIGANAAAYAGLQRDPPTRQVTRYAARKARKRYAAAQRRQVIALRRSRKSA